MSEKTLVIIKPDAMGRKIAGRVISRIEDKGLRIIGAKMMHLDDEILGKHYAEHKEKPFYGKLVGFMKTLPVIVFVIEGERAIDVMRKLAGPTYGVEAPAGTIRGDFALNVTESIVHASDSKESAEREIKIFFKKEEIFE